ncbi:MAG: hypothetical protein CK529_14190 [Rhodospirillaceae bacterium]|nr:MAG: hypothetical protein CK529_14190 [Rhodospirillaceae bacterium]
MKRIFAVAAILSALTASTVIAAETTQNTVSIEKQMLDLKKMVGSGEISSKEYNKRLAALRNRPSQQTAETTKK